MAARSCSASRDRRPTAWRPASATQSRGCHRGRHSPRPRRRWAGGRARRGASAALTARHWGPRGRVTPRPRPQGNPPAAEAAFCLCVSTKKALVSKKGPRKRALASKKTRAFVLHDENRGGWGQR
eukprot:1190379-Prymnesium_polylepis.1